MDPHPPTELPEGHQLRQQESVFCPTESCADAMGRHKHRAVLRMAGITNDACTAWGIKEPSVLTGLLRTGFALEDVPILLVLHIPQPHNANL